MRIGIIGPTETEIMPFINKIEDKEITRHAMINFHTGYFENTSVVAVVSGVCKVNAAIATQILIDKFDVTHIILTGVAGALDQRLQIGDVVIAKEVAHHDVAKDILIEYHPCMEDIYFRTDSKMLQDILEVSKSLSVANKFYAGRIISGEAFIKDSKRNRLIEVFEPQCVDMESAAVAHVCYVNTTPFLIIRAISDLANEASTETFESNVEGVSLHSLLLVEEFIKSYGRKKEI